MTRTALIRVAVLAGLVVAVPAVSTAQTPAPKKAAEVPKIVIPTDSQGRVVFRRETYGYPRDGRRDPFASLIATGDIRPLFNDLVLSVIIEAPDPRQSTATLKDASTGEIYRARVGSVFGRIRIVYIRGNEVGLAIDEFGFTRREVLTINAPSGERKP